MDRRFALCALAAPVLCLTASAAFIPDATAQDGCSRRSSFHLTSEGPWSGFISVRSGQPCGGGFFSGGSMRFKRLYLATPPQNGTVSLREGGYYSYQSKAGYRGPDVFVLRICGTEGSLEGCANVRYSVTVQ